MVYTWCMAKFEVFYKKVFDGRAGEAAFLDLDYQWAGELEATTVSNLQSQVAMLKADEEQKLEGQRPLRTGDVVRAPDGKHWILTPVGVWSQVRAFENPPPSAA